MIKHSIRLLAAAAVLLNVAFAQSVDEGKKFYYYERYESAKSTLESVLASKPDDVNAAYWLGQTFIQLKDIPAAKAVFQNALQSKGSDPLLLVGMGHVELHENKASDARQRFETAISLTKGRNIDVLNAIGLANAEAPAGDADYAIEKLNLATQVKRFKDASVYINLGNAHRKKLDGGGAVTAYNNALALDQSLAEAPYRVGKIYVTQGNDQASIFLKNYEEAVTIDPQYAPAYYDLYAYWYSRDVNKARDFFGKYKASTDFTPSVEAEEISLVYASGDFQGAIARADEKLQKDGDNASEKLYRVKGYAYDKMGDSVNALQNMEVFFSKADPEIILPDNYIKMAEIYAKFPDKLDQAELYFNKIIELDTVAANRAEYATAASNMYKNIKNREKSAEWLTKKLTFKPEYSKTDLFYASWENFYGSKYETADSLFNIYKEKYPDELHGYYGGFRTKWIADGDSLTENPVNDATKFVEIAEQDKATNKASLLLAYGYMAGYNANLIKDYSQAIVWLDKMIELDPNNEDVKANREILEKALGRPQQSTSSTQNR